MFPQFFLKLPVEDLERSKRFYRTLGYSPLDELSDERAACVLISDDVYVMLQTKATRNRIGADGLEHRCLFAALARALRAPVRAEPPGGGEDGAAMGFGACRSLPGEGRQTEEMSRAIKKGKEQ